MLVKSSKNMEFCWALAAATGWLLFLNLRTQKALKQTELYSWCFFLHMENNKNQQKLLKKHYKLITKTYKNFIHGVFVAYLLFEVVSYKKNPWPCCSTPRFCRSPVAFLPIGMIPRGRIPKSKTWEVPGMFDG